MKTILVKAAGLMLCAAMALTGVTALADSPNAGLPRIDMTRWQYNAEHDF